MSTRDKRIRRKPEVAEAEILNAARELLSGSDFRSLTVSAVMDRTGMKRAAFYNYFSDRNDLVMRLLGSISEELLDAASPWLETEDPAPALLGTSIDSSIDVYVRHGHILNAAHAAAFHDEAVERYYRHGLLQDFMDSIEIRIRAENKAGRTAVSDPEGVSRALVLMNATVMAERLGGQEKDSPESVSSTLRLMWARVIYGKDELD